MSSNIADTLGIGGILLNGTASAWDCRECDASSHARTALRRARRNAAGFKS